MFRFKLLVSIALALAVLSGCATTAREAAVRRPRHLIFNNDGDDALHYANPGVGYADADSPVSKQHFLDIRMNHIGDTGVDSVFYCTTQSINYFTHDSDVTEVFETKEKDFHGNRTKELIEQGADPLAVSIEACRLRDIEVFWTIRMNDIHDNFWEEMISQWKKAHPDMLLGKSGDKSEYPDTDPRHVWTWADFSRPEVRDLLVKIVEDVVDRYDVDGIDLDYLRHPAYFKECLEFKAATKAHRDMLTDMMAKMRQVILAASERKGKPILLSVRILPTVELNRRMGVDVERWVKEGYVDFIAIGGGYDPFTMPVNDLIDQGHDWGVPVYVCLSQSGFGGASSRVKGAKFSHSIECWRAAASNAWNAGADGIMTFNLFPKFSGSETTKNVRGIWQDISDTNQLAGKDKIFCIERVDSLWNTGFMAATVLIADRLPRVLKLGTTVHLNLPVGDPIAAMSGKVKKLRLRVGLSGWSEGDEVGVSMNGTPLDVTAEADQWLSADVSPTAMKQGRNTVFLTYWHGAEAELTVVGTELIVQYKQ